MRATTNEVVRIRLMGGIRTQDDAAIAVGVSRYTMANIEGANQMPSKALLGRMSQAYGCDPLDLERALLQRRAARLRVMLGDMDKRIAEIDVLKNHVDKSDG